MLNGETHIKGLQIGTFIVKRGVVMLCKALHELFWIGHVDKIDEGGRKQEAEKDKMWTRGGMKLKIGSPPRANRPNSTRNDLLYLLLFFVVELDV